jgi:uncharacterized protein
MTMRRLVLFLFAGFACLASAYAEPVHAPSNDADVAAGWAAYRSADHAGALSHYRKAAARNERVAQFNLAVMLLAGEGEPADPVAGVVWLRRSAELGFARAQHALGLLHERGLHVVRSLPQATGWFERAAEQGFREAQVSLGTQYFLGRGAALDYREAARWYERAAEQGDEASAYIVASLYERGEGVAQDRVRAFYWYSRAASGGDPAAIIKARELREQLSR